MKSEYDFKMDSRTVGSFVIEDDGFELRQWISFETDDGGRYENRYGVRYASARVLAYRVGERDWVDCSALPDDHYPTAAYPLLIRHGVDAYVAIDEETGKLTPRTLERDGNRVIEREAETTVRSFELRDDTIVRINWGGATSTLLSTDPSEG